MKHLWKKKRWISLHFLVEPSWLATAEFSEDMFLKHKYPWSKLYSEDGSRGEKDGNLIEKLLYLYLLRMDMSMYKSMSVLHENMQRVELDFSIIYNVDFVVHFILSGIFVSITVTVPELACIYNIRGRRGQF